MTEPAPGTWELVDAVIVAGEHGFVARLSADFDDETTEANGLLICAAKELLAALERVVDDLQYTGYVASISGTMKQVRAAIAKARPEGVR